MLGHHTEGVFQGKESAKCVEECWLGPRKLLSEGRSEALERCGQLCAVQERRPHEERLVRPPRLLEVRHCGAAVLLWWGG